MKILIVDDSLVIRRAIERAVSTDGNEIRTAGDGREALRVFDEFEPEVITMDITMPEMDGLSCVDAILTRNPEARVLVISALGDVGTAVEAVKRGARGFLLKPFTPESLNEEIEELFRD